MLSKRTISYFFLSINVIVWGAALVVVKPSLDVTTPFRYLMYRFVLASLLSVPILIYYASKIKKIRAKLPAIFLVELLGTTVALGLLYAGLARTSALEASLATTTSPLFVVLAGTWFLREREERHELAGLGLALLGTVLLVSLPLLLGMDSFKSLSLEGNILIMGQNIATALYFVLAKKHYAKLPKLLVASLSFIVGAVSFLLFSFWEAGFSTSTFLSAVTVDLQAPSVWIAAGYMAVFGSIIGLTAYIKGQDGIEASEASLFGYLQPLVYIPLAVIVLGDKLHSVQLVALVLILIGVFVAEKRKKRKRYS